jgi:hypothetical protein
MARHSYPLSKVYGLLEPGPVVLLTTAHRGRANVMTLSWHTIHGGGRDGAAGVADALVRGGVGRARTHRHKVKHRYSPPAAHCSR